MADINQVEVKTMLEQKADILKAIAHPIRLCILTKLLTEGICNVTDMHCCLDAPQSTVSQHLAKLRSAGVVSTERNGLEVKYNIADEQVIKILKIFLEEM